MKPFDGYETYDYAPMMQFIRDTETLQAELLGAWLIGELAPRSVIDVGCGPGIYLAPFDRASIRTLGIDAEESCPVRVDLRMPYTPPKRFDLAICLEVAEHLRPEFANTLVGSLARCSNAILFSAATPGQGGTNHYNEQPVEYWLDKFTDRGYALHPKNDALQAWLRDLGERYDAVTVSRWLIHHTVLLQRVPQQRLSQHPKK